MAKVVVIGQGYVGLPVAIRAAETGLSVIGLDVDERKVESLKQADSFVDDISDEQLKEVIDSGNYRASSDYNDAVGFDFAIITVPTPLEESMTDLGFIEAAGADLAPHISPGATVVLESTTYPGTTEELLVPILERGSGLKAGEDFYVGYSPERIDPGNKTWTFVNTPKVISGINEASLEKVREIYEQLVEKTVAVSTPKEAELTKLLENTFRHVNIALVNELAVFAHQLGVNIWESIEAANSKPFGYMKFTPGPGVGGHCLPVDPSYLSWQVRRKLGANFRFVELANDVNDHMPDYVVQRLLTLLNRSKKALNGSTVLVVGVAYKPDTGDQRESPSLKIVDLHQEYVATVIAADSHVPEFQWNKDIERVELNEQTVERADAAVVVTPHSDLDLSLLEGLPVLDTRNVMEGSSAERL
ncbi:MAG: nucleotide sugar dehydrogenase [Yaniella sp.]|nr:nucleotide sugar dehydrogenase [Yaniella sp.]